MTGISQLIETVYQKVAHVLATAPRGALSVTGILGLALLVYGYLQWRGDARAEEQRRQRQQAQAGQRQAGGSAGAQPQAASASGAAPATAGSAQSQPRPEAPCGTSATPVGRAVGAQLSGVKRVTLSLPGVLLNESSPAQLQEAATVRPEALEVVSELARATDLYLLAHVEDDIGEAVVTGALEAAGLLGSGPGKVKPHHVLCCSTLDGKVPIVRQLEPDLHVDGHPVSVEELRRFLPRLLLVREASGASGSGNVGVASSLPAYFGL
ncbi:hypothetical protein HYH03_009375 [Edaphochlamys debaryana]|uniref:Peroxisome assembly protein 22 n=1 Tax=Edaphochlamys debaryana TaxID=47281 RepID=A0A836BXY7_9CHLO|nr:hypothetical protein HYH03_009375 [Edaphochlamys debaryana]|eukprot:KAG2492432.1 hypothetical protein HYH03_009375 [Edaphochlamys debaryana]